MKLWYYREPEGNFGDDLNPWLWERLLPDAFDERDDVLFVGIGTLLNTRVPAAPQKVVFGSGVGYGDPPTLDHRWKIHCVRGPRSAAALSLPPEAAVTDGAALIASLMRPACDRRGVGFMPHHESASLFDWKQLCRRVGLIYLDPTLPADRTLSVMVGLECVIADAMHAAIVADALRVPWIPVSLYSHTHEFKWLDWCDSLNVAYSPVQFQELADNSSQQPIRRARGYLKRFRRTGSLTRIGRRAMVTPTSPGAVESVAQQLSDLRSDLARASLSRDEIFTSRLTDLRERLARVRSKPLDRASRDSGSYRPGSSPASATLSADASTNASSW